MIDKSPWLPFDMDTISRVPEATGIFELGDVGHAVVLVGCADRELLRDRLLALAKRRKHPGGRAPSWFRYEETHKPHAAFRKIVTALRANGGPEVAIDM